MAAIVKHVGEINTPCGDNICHCRYCSDRCRRNRGQTPQAVPTATMAPTAPAESTTTVKAGKSPKLNKSLQCQDLGNIVHLEHLNLEVRWSIRHYSLCFSCCCVESIDAVHHVGYTFNLRLKQIVYHGVPLMCCCCNARRNRFPIGLSRLFQFLPTVSTSFGIMSEQASLARVRSNTSSNVLHYIMHHGYIYGVNRCPTRSRQAYSMVRV